MDFEKSLFWGFPSGVNPYFLSNIQNFFFVPFFDKNKTRNSLALSKKEKKKKLHIVDKNHGLTPFTKITKMATFKNLYLYSQKSLSFDLEHHQKLFQGLFSQKRKKFILKNHELTPLRKSQKWRLLKSVSLKFKNPFFKN